MRCDLHSHSVFSDGTDTPQEIVAKAGRERLIIALTDHNTTSGLTDFMQEAQKQGVTAVAGTELSTVYGKWELHLLGLFLEPEHYDDVERLVKEFSVLKEISNIETVERLHEAGYRIDYRDVKKRNPTGNVNRAHMAAELMEKGYVDSVAQAFSGILSESAGYYVPPERLQFLDAVRFLTSIHALPIIAHPLEDLTPQELRDLLPEAIGAGLVGIEAYHSSYDQGQIDTALTIAEEFHLQVSGGSDYHGSVKPTIRLGVGRGELNIPEAVYWQLRDLWEKRRKS